MKLPNRRLSGDGSADIASASETKRSETRENKKIRLFCCEWPFDLGMCHIVEVVF